MERSSASPGPYRPWFRRRPGAALAAAAVLFALVTAVRVAMGADATAGVSMLYVLPISLVALIGGRGAGLTASGVALVLLGLWVLVDDVDLSLVGWASRAVPLVLAGVLLGDAAERLRRAERERVVHAAHEILRRQAVEVNDTLVQGMAVSKWALEAGDPEAALRALDDTLRTGQELVSELVRRSERMELLRSAEEE